MPWEDEENIWIDAEKKRWEIVFNFFLKCCVYVFFVCAFLPCMKKGISGSWQEIMSLWEIFHVHFHFLTKKEHHWGQLIDTILHKYSTFKFSTSIQMPLCNQYCRHHPHLDNSSRNFLLLFKVFFVWKMCGICLQYVCPSVYLRNN
jgi:hypothetical protein